MVVLSENEKIGSLHVSHSLVRKRQLMDDDDVLSEVEPDSVPNEVRNWLSMTFTRPVVVARKKADENKPKFKSVAQAIRAGIMVDRLVK